MSIARITESLRRNQIPNYLEIGVTIFALNKVVVNRI